VKPQPWDGEEDGEILGAVAEAVHSLGRVPESIRAAGLAAFVHRMSPDAALASLDYDSLLAEDSMLRAPEGPRIVVFRADSLTIDIAIGEDNLVGQLVPAAAGEVAMMTMDGVVGAVTADEMGCFELPPPSPGPVRFRCRVGGGEVFTDWLRL
jgi:hypothetical protein